MDQNLVFNSGWPRHPNAYFNHRISRLGAPLRSAVPEVADGGLERLEYLPSRTCSLSLQNHSSYHSLFHTTVTRHSHQVTLGASPLLLNSPSLYLCSSEQLAGPAMKLSLFLPVLGLALAVSAEEQAPFASSSSLKRRELRELRLLSSSLSALKGRFLHLTDFHPDPHYRAGTKVSDACHKKKGKGKLWEDHPPDVSPAEEDEEVLEKEGIAGKWGTPVSSVSLFSCSFIWCVAHIPAIATRPSPSSISRWTG